MADDLSGERVVYSSIQTLPDGHEFVRMGENWAIYCPEDETRTHDCQKIVLEFFKTMRDYRERNG